MKIIYFAKFQDNPLADIIENQISKALKKLKYQVIEIDVAKGSAKELVAETGKADMLLFHNAGMDLGIEQSVGKLPFYTGISGLYQLLTQIKCTKVMWYFERVVGSGEEYMQFILPVVDYAFLNDDTWVRRHKWDNVFGLHTGISEKEKGSFREEYACDIAFVGKPYGGRGDILSKLKQYYGKNFRMFDEIYGKDFADLCQSAKIIFHPKWGMNDFCWGSHIYHVLVCEGFLLYPRLYGLKEEGLDEGSHFAGYSVEEELPSAIEFFLKTENTEKRKQVAQQGRDYVLDHFTWQKRLEKMFEIIKSKLIK